METSSVASTNVRSLDRVVFILLRLVKIFTDEMSPSIMSASEILTFV